VGKTLAAVIAGEDHDGVVGDAGVGDGLKYAAYLAVEFADHRSEGLQRSAVEVGERPDALRFSLVHGSFPRPVRRGKVKAEEKRPAHRRIIGYRLDGAVAEE